MNLYLAIVESVFDDGEGEPIFFATPFVIPTETEDDAWRVGREVASTLSCELRSVKPISGAPGPSIEDRLAKLEREGEL